MQALDAESQGELATDLSAAEFLRRLYPEELPHPLDVWDRLREQRSRLTDRGRAFLEGYYEITKAALDERHAFEGAAWRERVFGGADERGAP